MPPRTKYNLVDSQGRKFTVVGDEALATAASAPGGARIESQEEEASREAAAGEQARYKGGASYVQGLVERALSGGTAGLSDFAIGELGGQYAKEGLHGRAVQTGTVGKAVEIGGAVLPALAGVGPTGVLSDLTAGAARTGATRLAARVGEKEAAALLAKQTALQTAKRIAVDTARASGAAAAEGAVYGAGSHLAAVGRGEEKLNGEALVSAAVGGAEVGGGLGAVGHLVTAGAGAGRKLIKADRLTAKAAGGEAATDQAIKQAKSDLDVAVRDSLSTSADVRAAAKRFIDDQAIANPGLALEARKKLAEAKVAADAAKLAARPVKAGPVLTADKAALAERRVAAGAQDFENLPGGPALDLADVSQDIGSPRAAAGGGSYQVPPVLKDVEAEFGRARIPGTTAAKAERIERGENMGAGYEGRQIDLGEPVPLDPGTIEGIPSQAGAFPARRGVFDRPMADDPAIHVPDAAGLTPLQRAMGDLDPELGKRVKLVDDLHASDADLSHAHRLATLSTVDPQAAKLYGYAVEGATPDMRIREKWTVNGRSIKGDFVGRRHGPRLNLTVDELTQDTVGRIREALVDSNPAERKVILDKLAVADPGKLRDVMRGRHNVFNASDVAADRLGGQWRSPLPNTPIAEEEWGARFLPRFGENRFAASDLAPVAAKPAAGFSQAALDDLVARQGGIQKPVQAFDEAGVAVPGRAGTGPTRRMTAEEQAAMPEAGAGRPVEEVIYDPALDASQAVPGIARGSQRSEAVEQAGVLSQAMEPYPAGAFDVSDVSAAHAEGLAAKAKEMGVSPEVMDDWVASAKVGRSLTDRDLLLSEAARLPEMPPSVVSHGARMAESLADQDRRVMKSISNHAEDIDTIPEPIAVHPGDRGSLSPRFDAGEPMPGRNPSISDLLESLGEPAPHGSLGLPAPASDLEAIQRTATMADAIRAPVDRFRPGSPRNLARATTLAGGDGRMGAATLVGDAASGAPPAMPVDRTVARSGYGASDLSAVRGDRGVRATGEPLSHLSMERHGKWERGLEGKAPAAKGGILSTLANVGTGLEALQAVGVHTPFDPDKIPLIGPLLGPYFKLRGAMMAARRFGILAPATGHARAVERAMAVRNKMLGGADKVLGVAGKGGKALSFAAPIVGWRLRDVLDRPLDPSAVESAKRRKMTDDEALRESANEARALAANPEAVAASVRRSLPPGTDPDLVDAAVATAQRRAEYLASVAPVEPPTNLFHPVKWVTSLGEAVKWARRLRVAQDPSTISSDIAHGRLTTEAAETFKAVYPAMFQETRSYLLQRAVEIGQRVAPDMVTQLSALFGVALRPTLEPDAFQRLQEAGPRPDAVSGLQAPMQPSPGLPGAVGLAQMTDPSKPYRLGQ